MKYISNNFKLNSGVKRQHGNAPHVNEMQYIYEDQTGTKNKEKRINNTTPVVFPLSEHLNKFISY